MQIYDARESRKGTNACSYCRQHGHNVTKCPHVAPDWASWERMEVPLKDLDCWVHKIPTNKYGRSHYYKIPRYWGEWYQNAANAHAKQEAAKKKAGASRQQRGPRKCGFCGEEGHTRRNCAELLVFRQKANRANQAIRRYVYDTVIAEHGIDRGALINPRRHVYDWQNRRYVESDDGVCTVLRVAWDSVSVTIDNANFQLDPNLRTSLAVTYLTPAGTQRNMSIDINETIAGHRPEPTSRYHTIANKTWINQVISPSPTPLDEEWVRDARQDAFDWLSTKRSKEWLEKGGLTEVIERWAARYKDEDEQ